MHVINEIRKAARQFENKTGVECDVVFLNKNQHLEASSLLQPVNHLNGVFQIDGILVAKMLPYIGYDGKAQGSSFLALSKITQTVLWLDSYNVPIMSYTPGFFKPKVVSYSVNIPTNQIVSFRKFIQPSMTLEDLSTMDKAS